MHGVYNHGWLIGDERMISPVTQAELDSLLAISPSKQSGEEASGQNEQTAISTARMSEAEDPGRVQRKQSSGEVTVEDVRQLMGASTPHFALQLRNRIAALIADLPPGHPARARRRARDRAGSSASRLSGENRGEGFVEGERPLPSLELAPESPPRLAHARAERRAQRAKRRSRRASR